MGSRLFLFLLLFLSLWVVTRELLLDLLQNALLLLHIAFMMSRWLRSAILCNRRRRRRWDFFRLLVLAWKFFLNLFKEALLFFSLSWLCHYYLFFVPLNWDAGVLVLLLFVLLLFELLLFELLLFFLVSSTSLLLDFILQSLLFLPFLLLLFSFTFLLIARLQFSNNPKFNYKLF